MKIEIAEDAKRDLVDGADFYDRQSPQVGDYFLESLFADISSLKLFAGVHVRHFDYHRMLSKRFPYAIYYRVDGDTARVYAVLDCRRDPTKLHRRLNAPT